LTASPLANARNDGHFRRAQNHSALVGTLKRLLPIMAIGLVVWFVAVSLFGTYNTGNLSIDSSSISNGKLVMEAPKLNGFSDSNLPYDLSASRAVQDLKNPGLIELEKIQATIPMEAGIFADIDALSGVYNTDKEWLSLNKQITVRSQDGTVIRLSTAEIDLSKGVLTSINPVTVTTNNTSISADQVDVLDSGSVIVFKKRVRMTIRPSAETN